jgi:acetyl-CoA synthetase
MSDSTIYPVNPEFSVKAHIDQSRYEEMYQRSLSDPDGFWAEQAEAFVDWFSPWDTVRQCNFHTGEIRWFDGATLNAAYNCIDRHLETRGEQTAIIWEGDEPSDDKKTDV